MFVSPQNLYVEILMPNVLELEDEAFGKCLGYESGVFRNETNVLIKESQKASCLLGHVRTQKQSTSHVPESELSPESYHVDALVFDFLSFRTMRNKFQLFIRWPVHGILL